MKDNLGGMIVRVLSALVLLVLLLPPSVAAGPGGGKGKPADRPAPETEVQVKESHQVRLITGDLVKVIIMTDGKRSYSISPADPGKLGQRFLTFDQDGSTYIIPDGINLEKLDMELFNIDYLINEAYDKETVLPLLVSYQPTLSTSEVQSLQNRVQALSQETEPLQGVSALSSRLPYDHIAASYQNMVAQPEVKRIWLNKKVYADLADSVPLIGAPSWWDAGYSGNGTKIAILDTGIDSTHSSLDDLDDSANTTDPKVVVNINFSTDNDTVDRHGHGTHVSGIAAGTSASQAYSGEYAWFSGAADNLNVTLTRAFDLTSVNSTTLRFWTKYDIEEDYDYGYLKISTDNGTSWTTLATYTGESAGPFTQLSYNLTSNFTGRNILVRFQYVTDSSFANMGWYIDDIEMPGIGFIDNAESTSGNWTTIGWTRARMLSSKGVAPAAKLWNVKVLNQWGWGYNDQIINGINFASLGPDGIPRTGDEADVINMSLGGGVTDGTDPLSQAVNLAVGRGVVVVIAAGNSGPNPRTVSSPGVAEKAITVGATLKDDTLAPFSSRGPTIDNRIKPDIVAPGVSITSAKKGGGTEAWSGTSMSTPHVAGATALLRQRYGDNVTPQFIKDALMYTAKDLSLPVYQQGSGRLNLTFGSWPKVGVTPASRSLGRFANETAASSNFTFFNTDNVSHQVVLSANLTREVAGTAGDNYSAVVTLTPASFSIPASGNVSVNVTANLTALLTGPFSGRIKATVDNTTSIHAIFGFSKLRQVTLLKTDVTGAPARNHPVWVMMSSPREEMLVDWKFTSLSGNLTFHAPDGMYNILSPNWGNAANQTDIWTVAENVTVNGDMTVSLDERNTLGVGFNPNKPEKLIPSAKSSTLYYETSQTAYGWISSWWYPQSFAARVSPFRKFDAGFVYNAYPEADFLRDGPGLVNADEWLNLLYSVDNITSNTTFVADYPNLVRRPTRYGVALEGEKAYLYQYVFDPVSWVSSAFGYTMDAPRTRTEWLSPQPALYFTSYTKAVYEPGNRWGFVNGFKATSGNYTSLIGIHPLTSGLYTYIWPNYYGSGKHSLYIYGPISSDQSGNSFYNYGASISGHLKITNNTTGSILERDIWDSFSMRFDFDGTANLTVEVWGQTPLKLSPTNYTRLSFTANVSRDYRPPRIYTNLDRLNNRGIVPAGSDIIARVRAYDDSIITSVQLAYALGDSGNWTDAGTPTLSAGEYQFNLGALQNTFVSLRVQASDQYGNRIQRVDDRAFYVGMPGLQVRVNAPPLVVPSLNFTATVNISNVANLDAANYDIVFDPTVLSLVDVTGGSINGTAVPVDMWNQRSAGRYTIVQNVPGLAGATGNGTISTLRFQVLGGYGTSSSIGLENGVLSDNQSQAIMAGWIGAQVTATGRTGDATGDNLIDARDITKVERIIVRLDSPTPGADANKDDDINAVDITKVERFIAGLDTPGPVVPEVEWTKTFGGVLAEYGWTVQQTSDGGYIIAGSTNSTGAGSMDIYLVKTDSSGNMLWGKTFGDADYEWGRGVQQTSDGGYIVTGETRSLGAGLADIYLVKTDSSGNMTWSKTYGGTGDDIGRAVQQTADGGYIIAGFTNSPGASGWDVYLIKTDSSGNLAWSKTFGGTNTDAGFSVRQTSDGGYVIAGYTYSSGSGWSDAYLIKTDSSGNAVWSKTFGSGQYEFGWSVRQTSDGGYIIAGSTNSTISGSTDVYLLKTDTSGNALWSRTFGGTHSDVGWSVRQTSDSGYIIVGYTWSSGAGAADVYLVKTDSSGNMTWSKTLGGVASEWGYDVQQTSDGGYIVAGETISFGSGSYDVYLIKLK